MRSSVTRYPSRCLWWALVCLLGLSGGQVLASRNPYVDDKCSVRDSGPVMSLFWVPPLPRDMLYLVNISEG